MSKTLNVIIGGHGVPDFKGWAGVFQQKVPQLAVPMGVSESWAGEGDKDEKGNPTCVVVHMYDASKQAVVEQFHDFTGPPFVGGDDLIEKGIVIPPFFTQYIINAQVIQHQEVPEGEALEFGVFSHRVPDYDAWATLFTTQPPEFHLGLGITTSIVGDSPSGNKPVVIHFYLKSHADKIKAAFSDEAMENEPFASIIKSGAIILPFERRFSSLEVNMKF